MLHPTTVTAGGTFMEEALGPSTRSISGGSFWDRSDGDEGALPSTPAAPSRSPWTPAPGSTSSFVYRRSVTQLGYYSFYSNFLNNNVWLSFSKNCTARYSTRTDRIKEMGESPQVKSKSLKISKVKYSSGCSEIWLPSLQLTEGWKMRRRHLRNA